MSLGLKFLYNVVAMVSLRCIYADHLLKAADPAMKAAAVRMLEEEKGGEE